MLRLYFYFYLGSGVAYKRRGENGRILSDQKIARDIKRNLELFRKVSVEGEREKKTCEND